MGEVRVSLRLASISLAIVGLWFVVLVPFHQDVFDRDVAMVVLQHVARWQAIHAGMFVAGVAGVFGAAGLVAAHGDRLGRIAQITLIATVVSAAAASGAGLLEATIFPVAARRAPDLIDFQGPLFTSVLFRSLSGPWLLFPICFAALGELARRAGDHRRAGAALAGTGVGFFALGMWFVPVVGVLSSIAFGAALGWWAAILWSAARTADATGRAARPDVRAEWGPR